MSPCCVFRSNLTHHSLRDQTFDAWNVYFVRSYVMLSWSQNLLLWILIPCLYLNIWETAAVSLKSSFGTKEECFPLFHSVHHTHGPSWSGLKGKWNWHHFLFSFLPIKRWIQQRCTWPEFSHIPLRGAPLLRTYFRPFSGRCACLSLEEGKKFVWKLLTGSTEAEHWGDMKVVFGLLLMLLGVSHGETMNLEHQ